MMATVGYTQEEIATRLRELPSTAISDALDQAGIEGALHGGGAQVAESLGLQWDDLHVRVRLSV